MRTLCLALLLAGLPLGVAFAQVDEDTLFGGENPTAEDPADTPTDPGDEEGLFGGEGNSFVNEVEEDPAADPAGDLLTSESVTVGGDFGVSVEGGLDIDAAGETSLSSGVAELGSELFLDARPNSDLRVLAGGDLGYSTASGATFELSELFADTDLNNTVFFRAGKQTVNWGVGYFYSPANLVNLERVDPENPEAELAGPVALRAQVPFGTDNLTGYVISDDLADDLNLSAAALYEYLVSGFEVTSGGIAEAGGHYAVMSTASGTLYDVTVFAEAVLEGGSDKVFVIKDGSAPSGLGTATSDSLFFSGTVGGRYSYDTDDERFSFSATAQYFFNGLGYDDPSLLTDNADAVAALVGAGALTLGDLQERGRHYVGVSLSSPDVDGSDVTPSASWLANLSDGSGLVNAGMSYSLGDAITTGLEYGLRYGPEGAEYSATGLESNLTLSVGLSGTF